MPMGRLQTFYLPAMLLTLALTSCTSVSQRGTKSLPPGFLYKGGFLNIRSPNEKGWYPVAVSHASIQFARHGAEKGEKFNARVYTFPLPKMQEAKQLLNYLKKDFKAETNSKHYAVLKSTFRLTKTRKYPCVRVSAVIQDKRASTSASDHKKLLLQSVSLYCRHPVEKSVGFSIIYSHRGRSLYPDLNKKAQDFIEGVQVPGH